MRKWLIIAGGVLLALVAVGALALMNLNSLINRNKEYLLAKAQESLGRTLGVGDIGLTLWGGIGVRLKDFSMSDDPAFSKEPFVRAADLQVNMKLLPLLRKELQVRNLVLHQPVINVIRNQSGLFNFSTIGGEKEKKEKEKVEKEKKEKAPGGPPALAVALVDVDGGEIHYLDNAKGVDFHATRVDFKIKDINYERPIDVSLEAAILGAAKQNFKLKGRVGPIGPDADFTNLPIDGDVELDTISLADLEKTLPGFSRKLPKGLGLAGSVGAKSKVTGRLGKDALPDVSGTLTLSGVSARVPSLAQPVTDLNAKVSFTGGNAELPESAFHIGKSEVRLAAKIASFSPVNASYRISSRELNLADVKGANPARRKPEVLKDLKGEGAVVVKDGAVASRGSFTSSGGSIADGDYKDLKTTVALADRVATIDSLTLGAFAGALSAKGRYDMREAAPRFGGTVSLKGMDLTQMFRAFAPTSTQNVRGLVDADLDVTGAGKEWDAIQKSLKGTARAEVKNGALVDVNLADSVMSSGIPINLVPADIRKKYPAIFSSKDTEFKQMKASAAIGDGRARTDDLIVSAAEFETQGKGWVGFDRTIDFKAMLTFSQQLSQDILSKAKEAKGLANDKGQIEVPFTISGKLPGAKPKPDMNYIARAMQKGFMQGDLNDLFGKKKKNKKDKDSADTAPADEGTPADTGKKKKKNTTKDDIVKGLQGLFGKQ